MIAFVWRFKNLMSCRIKLKVVCTVCIEAKLWLGGKVIIIYNRCMLIMVKTYCIIADMQEALSGNWE